MIPSLPSSADPFRTTVRPAENSRAVGPAWFVSGLLHGALLVLLGVSIPGGAGGMADEAGRETGIALVAAKEDDSAAFAPEETAASVEAAEDDSEDPLADALAPSDSNETRAGFPGDQTLGVAASDDASAPAAGGAAPAEGGRAADSSGDLGTLPDGQARTTVFGLLGTGHRFVYVFDRSGSMGGSGHTALAAAKAELLASLSHLDSQHQFQIVFYNDEPALFQVDSRGWRLLFATEQNKHLAGRFVDSIRADGATEHEPPLMLALKLQPDVIYFLTDADQPALTPTQLARVRQVNQERTAIHAIEFGRGPALTKDNFLVQLAQQNGGRHVYVDVANQGRSP